MRNNFPVRYSHTIAVLSRDVEIAMLFLLWLWPTATLVIGALWWENVRSGELDCVCVWEVDGRENEVRRGIDHTWIFESSEPDKMKLLVGSTINEVTGCKWEAVVDTWRPVHVYKKRLGTK